MEKNNEQNLNPEQSTIKPIPSMPAKKLSSKIIVVTILAVTAGIVSWVALTQQPKTDLSPIVVNHKTEAQPTATTTPQTSPNDFKNWKIYTDAQNGFAFQYPNDWVLNKVEKDVIIIDSPESAKERQKDPYMEAPSDIGIFIDQNSDNFSAQKYYNGSKGEVLFDNPNFDTTLKIDSLAAYKLYPTTGIGGNAEVIIIPKKGYFIRIEINTDSKVPGQILTTFRLNN